MALAKRSGLSQKAISSWEVGDREPMLSAVVALAQALGVEITDFLEQPKKRRRKGSGK
jgi:transcriptional regulator with XRE-family HTH domain